MTSRPLDWMTSMTLGLLALGGLLTAVLEVLYLPSYIGSTPFPISALAAAVINVALVLLAAQVSDRTALVALPLLAWLIGLGLCLLPTHGGSVIVTQGESGRLLLLLALGVLPAFVVLARHRIRSLAAR